MRLPHKWREAWRRGPFTERGRGVVFKASTPHDHGVGRGRFTRPLSSARPPRVSHALGVANGGGGKPGRHWLGQRVGPGSLRLPCLDWPSGAAEPQPRSFIKRGRGMASLILSSSSSFSFCSSLPSVMERGNPGPSTVAARVAARQRVPPPPEPVVVEPAARGRGRVRGRGRGRGRGRSARGRGGRGGAPASPPPMVPFPMEGHVGDQLREFFIRLRRPPRRRLRLPAPFAWVMERDPPRPSDCT